MAVLVAQLSKLKFHFGASVKTFVSKRKPLILFTIASVNNFMIMNIEFCFANEQVQISLICIKSIVRLGMSYYMQDGT